MSIRVGYFTVSKDWKRFKESDPQTFVYIHTCTYVNTYDLKIRKLRYPLIECLELGTTQIS